MTSNKFCSREPGRQAFYALQTAVLIHIWDEQTHPVILLIPSWGDDFKERKVDDPPEYILTITAVPVTGWLGEMI